MEKITIQELQKVIKEILRVTVEVLDKNNITYYIACGSALGVVRHGGFIPWDDDIDIVLSPYDIDKAAEVLVRDLPEKYFVDYYKLDKKSLRKFPRVGIKGYSTKCYYIDVFFMLGLPDDRQGQVKHAKEIIRISNINKTMSAPLYKKILRFKFKDAFRHIIHIFDKQYYCKYFWKISNQYSYADCTYAMIGIGVPKFIIIKKEWLGKPQPAKFEDIDVKLPENIDEYLKAYYGDYMSYPSQEHIDKQMNRLYEIY